MNEPKRPDAYAAAGVDYAAIDPGKLLAQRTAADTAHWLSARGLSEVSESRGESAYVIELPDRYISLVNEALGTKNLVADATRPITGRTHYDAIARDTVATILNDLCSLGGQPMALTAYWGAGSSSWFDDTQRMADLIAGWGAACAQARCAWGGGETQALSGMIDASTIVLGGSALGSIHPKHQLLLGSKLRVGDAILCARSSGIHANGLTLARKLAEAQPSRYATPVPDDPAGRCLGEVLLDPSPLYGPIVEVLQGAGVDLHYVAHVTGHGWRKVMRAAPSHSYIIDAVPEVPAVLRFLQQLAGMDQREAYGTFNMGAGFMFFVAASEVARAQTLARERDCELDVIGHVEAGPRRVVLRPINVTFDGESLNIR